MRKGILVFAAMLLFVMMTACGTQTKTDTVYSAVTSTVTTTVYSSTTNTVYSSTTNTVYVVSDVTATITLGSVGNVTAGTTVDVAWSGTMSGGWDVPYALRIRAVSQTGTCTVSSDWDNETLICDNGRYPVADVAVAMADLDGSEKTSSVQIPAALPAGNYTLDVELVYSSSSGSDVVLESTESAIFYVYETSSVQAPLVKTSDVAVSQETTAKFKGRVGANGAATTVWFEYGTDSASLGLVSGTVNLSGGEADIEIDIAGLTGGTTYYYRVVAQNSSGTSYGKIFSCITTTPTVTAPVP